MIPHDTLNPLLLNSPHRGTCNPFFARRQPPSPRIVRGPLNEAYLLRAVRGILNFLLRWLCAVPSSTRNPRRLEVPPPQVVRGPLNEAYPPRVVRGTLNSFIGWLCTVSSSTRNPRRLQTSHPQRHTQPPPTWLPSTPPLPPRRYVEQVVEPVRIR